MKVKYSLLNFGLFFIMFGWMKMGEGGKNILKIRDSLRRLIATIFEHGVGF